MKSIGGYLELELNDSDDYHSDLIRLNTGKNALEVILLSTNYKKVYIPYFTCQIVHQTFQKLKINVEYYNIDFNFEPIFDFDKIEENEAFLFTNYFGIKTNFVEFLSQKNHNIIIDNAQAFFTRPIKNNPTFYSARKFFGVPDGAYLSLNNKESLLFEKDISKDRMKHLLTRKELNAEDGYSYYQENEKKLEAEPIKLMSKLTESLLRNVNYTKVADTRIKNFNSFQNALKNQNKLKLTRGENDVPLVYPYWGDNYNIKNILKENNIYTPTYWPGIKLQNNFDGINLKTLNEIIYLPVDQTITHSEIKTILDIILQ